jgi:putative addiction module CopG family antidote
MTIEVPADMHPFVDEMVSKRRFLTQEEVIREGLRLLQSREILREEVQKGFEQLDRGEKLSAGEVRRRAEAAIAQQTRGT